jgi:hypothetical protein
MCRILFGINLLVLGLAAEVVVCDLRAESATDFLTAREQASRIDFVTAGSLNRSRGLAYEELVQSQREAAGYRVLQTKSPNNMGVDRIATRNGKVQFIQAKAYQSVRVGAVGGSLDALEFYGGNPDKRIPFLQDSDRRFIVSIPKDKYAKGVENGLIGKNGTLSQELIQLTKSESIAITKANPNAPKSLRYRGVAGNEQEILTKVRFEPGPVAYDEIPVSSINRSSRIKYVGLASEETAVTGFQTAGKWMGRAGVVVLVATEGYVIYGCATGRLSDREFVSAQSAIVGGGLGAWGGATAGAVAGGVIGGPPGAVIGGVIGGIAGGFGGAELGEMAASGYYGRLDDDQKKQVEAFIYQHYGVNR